MSSVLVIFLLKSDQEHRSEWKFRMLARNTLIAHDTNEKGSINRREGEKKEIQGRKGD